MDAEKIQEKKITRTLNLEHLFLFLFRSIIRDIIERCDSGVLVYVIFLHFLSKQTESNRDLLNYRQIVTCNEAIEIAHSKIRHKRIKRITLRDLYQTKIEIQSKCKK